MALRAYYETDREALLKMIEARHDDIARVGHNTTAETAWDEPGGVVVYYHGHPIVRLHADGDRTLRDCGYRTITTKERLNLYAPTGVKVWQEKFVWYYEDNTGTVRREWHGEHRFSASGIERVGAEA